MSLVKQILTLPMFLLALNSASAQDKPPLPYESKGLCPFECCTYRSWVAEKDIQVLTQRKPGAPVAFTLKKGDKVKGVTGVVITTELGVAKGAPLNPQNPDRMFKPGEKFYLLSGVGEGCYLAWNHGKPVTACMEEYADPVQEPKTEWWVHIKNSKGQTGWVNWPHDQEYFSNVDACG
ncbi:MAG: hypothetical protein U1F66_11035 [bacterium]